MGGGAACTDCRAVHTTIRQTIGTLFNSRVEGAHLCGVELTAPNMKNLSPVWASNMVLGGLDIMHRPYGEGVIVPMLFASMGDAACRSALADCFSAWMSAAYASPPGSLLATLVQGTGAFYFGITDDPQQRWAQHKASTTFGRHHKGDWMMRAMVSLAAGLTEDKSGPWEKSIEGTLRLCAEQLYPEKPVINQPEDDMAHCHGARSASILDIQSWETGGVAAYTRILDMRRNGVDPVKRGSGIARLVEQLALRS